MKQLARIEDEVTSFQVRQQIERTRAKVAASVDALRDDVRESVAKVAGLGERLDRGAKLVKKGKAWAQQHPWALVAGGVALGLLLGSRRR